MGLASMTICMSLLCGCKNETKEEVAQKSPTKDYNIFIYNSDTNIGKAFREMCDEYTKRTGVIIRTVTPTEEENTIENLDSYINSEYPPDIYTISSMDELKRWQQSESVWDFNNATEENFKEVVNNIPLGLRLSTNNSDSFGVPATIEGYGYLMDLKMLASLVGEDKYHKVLNDLKKCSYEEFEYFVDALNYYINSEVSSEFTLNEKTYSFADSKGELSKNLKSVFSFPGGDSKICGSYLMNPILSSVFGTAAEAYIANDTSIESLSSPLMKFAQQLDLISSSVASDTGVLTRGADFISTSKNGSVQSIKNFINGRSLFLIASTSDYERLSIFDSSLSKRCVFIPIKVAVNENDVNLEGKEFNNNLNKSINVTIPRYYCINGSSSDEEKKAAQDFLVWFKTSDLAQKYVVSEFGYVPYDIEDGSVLDNPLDRSLIEYVKENKFLPPVFMGAPGSWCQEVMGKYIINTLFTKPVWSLEDYESLVDYGLGKWKELKQS